MLLTALPIYNVFGTQWNAVSSISAGDLLHLSVDLTMIVFAVAFLWLARRVARYRLPVRVGRVARTRANALSKMEAAARHG